MRTTDQVDVITNNTNALYAIKLLDEAVALGLDRGELLADAGVHRSEVDNPEAHLAMEKYLRLVEVTMDRCEAPDLGFRVGEHTSLMEHGVLGYAMLNSANFAECLQRYCRYQRLVGPLFEVEVVTEGDVAMMCTRPLPGGWQLSPSVIRYYTQEWLATGVIWASLIGRDYLFTEVEIAHSAEGGEQAYENHLKLMPRFGQSGTRAKFPAEWLSLPLQVANESIGAMCAQQCERLLDELSHYRGWAAEVYRQLSLSPGEIPNMNAMADRLHMASRTLRRRLDSEGLTYQQLVIDFRLAMARQYLRESQLPVNEVAELVGYANPANFYRTFLRAEGMTPQKFRTVI
jgi:AraC-like DNA-binding protein